MFSSRLKSLREDNDLTQADLAKSLNLSRETIKGYENYNKEPNFATLIKLDYLLCRTKVNIPFSQLYSDNSK